MLQLYKGEPGQSASGNSPSDYVGEADFDLAKYGKSVSIVERLLMRGANKAVVTEDSFIEIMVKTKSLEAPQTPSADSLGGRNSISIENRFSQQ